MERWRNGRRYVAEIGHTSYFVKTIYGVTKNRVILGIGVEDEKQVHN